MPIFEYVCAKCGHQFEVAQSIKAEPLTVCPKDQCAKKTWGKGKVKRAVGGGAGLIFKGSGFYITDYRSDKYKAAAKSDASSSSGASSSSSEGAKKESKPAPSSGSSGSSAKKD